MRFRTGLFALGVSASVAFGQAALGQAAWAQAPQPPAGQQGTATIHVTTRETIVDVTVTDARGRAVHGLVAGDFTIKEDGKVQPLRSFAEYGETPVLQPPKLPSNVFTNRQPPPASSVLNVLLLDFVNTAPVIAMSAPAGSKDLAAALFVQKQAKQEAMKYIATMPPGTRMEVMGMAWPSKLRLLQGATSDPALLRAAVDTMEFATDAQAMNYQTYCTQQDMRNRMTIEAMQQVAEDLIGIKGKKNLLWFTTGIPLVTNAAAGPPCLPDYYTGLTRAYGLMTAAQIAVNPVNTNGVGGKPDSVFTLRGTLYTSISTMPAQQGMLANLGIAERTSEEELSLEAVASVTGGTAYYNTNDLAGAMRTAIAKGANYYTLSYVPPSLKYDGHYHRIKVELNQPELKLAYRTGYLAVDPADQTVAHVLTLGTDAPEAVNGDMKAPMSRSMPVSTDILFDVQVEPSTEPAKPGDPPVMGELDAKLKGKRLVRYGFQYDFPARQIDFAEEADGMRTGSIEFDVAAYDAQGKLVTSLSQTIKPSLTQAQFELGTKGPMRFFQQVDLPPGQMFVRVGIFDGVAKKVGTVEIPVLAERK